MRLFIAAVAAAALSGCATEIMSEKQCLAGDWRAAGFEDGTEGRLETALDERAARCAQFGAAVDDRAYFDGRRAGLDRLCTGPGGYEYGRAGKSYVGVCAPGEEQEFLGAYLEGWRISRAEAARAQAESAYNSAVYAVDGYREDIRRARRVFSDKDATEKEIARARKDLDDARDNLPYAERRVDDLLYELGRADEALSQTRSSMAGWRTSKPFALMIETLQEAHEMARSEPAFDFCTDDGGGHYPRCELRPGAALKDGASGRTCAFGPAEARFARRMARGIGGARTGVAHAYDVYPRDPANGRVSRVPQGGFDAFFGADGGFEGVACSSAP